MSRKLIFALAGRPLAAQYGVYTLPRGYNSATVPRVPLVEEIMIVQRWVALTLAAAFLSATAEAAELPSQRGHSDKSKKAEYVTPCNVAGFPGVLAADGVCVRFSGYVSSQFTAGQVK